MPQQKPTRNLFTRLFTRMFVALTIVILLYLVILYAGPYRTILQKNAHDGFQQRVSSRAEAVEQILWRWSNLDSAATALNKQLTQLLNAEGADVAQMRTDAALNHRLLSSMYESLVNLLWQLNVNDVYLILDGPGRAVEGVETARAGLYLRCTAPNSYTSDNSNLLLRMGMSDISRNNHIALDSWWQPCYLPEACVDNDFFEKPRSAYLQSPGTSRATATDWGYWSAGHKLYAQDTADLLTYSIPLFNADGELWGVMGVGVFQQTLEANLTKALPGDNGCWVLAKQTENDLKVIWASGEAAYAAYVDDTVLHLLPQEGLPTYRMQSIFGIQAPQAVAVSKLNLYASNAPYHEAPLVIAGVTSQTVLDRASNQMMTMLSLLGITTWALGIVGTPLLSWKVSRPITGLAKEIMEITPNGELHLTRTGIQEIDTLGSAIEQKNREVIASASRFSEIIEMTGKMLGVFEVRKDNDKAFLAGILLQLLVGGAQQSMEMDKQAFKEKMQHLFQNRLSMDEDIYRLIDKNGEHKWVRVCIREADGSICGVVIDITEQIDHRLKIDYEHTYDALTDLMNNRAFSERMHRLLRDEQQLGLGLMLMWDLDNLKTINDTYGHESGDSYIHAFANWLKTIAVPNGFSARRSGDEFFTFVYGFGSDVARLAFLARLGERLGDLSGEVYNGDAVAIHASAGACRYPEDAREVDDLIRCADYAMYTIKRGAKGHIALFNPAQDTCKSLRVMALEKLNRLVQGRLVRFAYQPIVRLRDARVVGYEMLMRPQGGDFSSPPEVLNAAKSLGALYQVERMTLFGALEQAAQDRRAGRLSGDVRLLVNSIANECLTPEDTQALCDMVLPVLDHQIVVEVTECEPLNPELMTRKRQLVRSLHGKFALDDYGTGYNGQTTLLTLYPEMIKLDRSLVRGLDTDAYKQQFLKKLSAFANERGMLVLAEGVETEAELYAAYRCGAGYAQGFFLARPDFTPPVLAQPVRDALERLTADAAHKEGHE